VTRESGKLVFGEKTIFFGLLMMIARLVFFFFVAIKPENPYLASALGSK